MLVKRRGTLDLEVVIPVAKDGVDDVALCFHLGVDAVRLAGHGAFVVDFFYHDPLELGSGRKRDGQSTAAQGQILEHVHCQLRMIKFRSSSRPPKPLRENPAPCLGST